MHLVVVYLTSRKMPEIGSERTARQMMVELW